MPQKAIPSSAILRKYSALHRDERSADFEVTTALLTSRP
jgi:hypothetical protein